LASSAISMRDGGNQWSGSACFVSFGRYCLMLDIDYTKWDAYERLTVLSGPRYVHERFCIVCDRPAVLTTDNASPPRPHNDDGPFCVWRDGVELFMVHNVSIPAWVFKDPTLLTMERIEQERNAEVKRVMLSKYGIGKYLAGPGVRVRDEVAVDAKGVPSGMRGAKLVERALDGDRDPVVALMLLDATPEDDGTRETYFIEVDPRTKTVLEGLAAGYRVTPKQYLSLAEET